MSNYIKILKAKSLRNAKSLTGEEGKKKIAKIINKLYFPFKYVTLSPKKRTHIL
jgi:hypothetical protein